jgi:hypothetical protein
MRVAGVGGQLLCGPDRMGIGRQTGFHGSVVSIWVAARRGSLCKLAGNLANELAGKLPGKLK